MSIVGGTRIGPYEVVRSLGAGGMGEVYRAHDPRLGRDVAIKVLPELFARDPERMARFEREAQLLASINHPNIAGVYGVEETHGLRALVMELVEGETLADRISRGPLPFDEALPLGRQIAEALEAAHDRGIIHRDLKPSNIKLTADGQVKVLDFGLAKAVEPTGLGTDLAHSPTMSVGTKAGLILGTAAYMSPEQARGRATDRRTDVWGFGCVLYEMLSGHQAFGGDSVTDLIAAIMKEDPDWHALPADVPAGAHRLVRRCLRKDPRQRLHDMADARLEIEDALAEPTAAASDVRAVEGRQGRLVGSLVALATIFALAAGLLAWRLAQPGPPWSVVRFFVGVPRAGDELSLNFNGAALSPDGSRVLLVVQRGSDTQLFLRRLDEFEAKPVAGTERGFNPFFSPDGKWIAFTAEQRLKKIGIDGGSPLVLCEANWGGGAWGQDDTIIFTPHYSKGLWKVPAGGGTPEKLTDPDTSRGELGHWWPQFLPDGRHLLFTSFSTPIERSRIVVYSLDTGTQRVVVEGGTFGRYLPTGHLLYMRAESLMAAPFDPDSQEVEGSAVPVLDDVAWTLSNGVAQVSVASNGTLGFIAASAVRADSELIWLDRKGTTTPAVPIRRRYSNPRLSPDGRRLAVTIDDGNRDVWTYDFARGVFGRVTSGPASEFGALWTVDGRNLVFISERPVFQIFRKPPVGSAPEESLVAAGYDSEPSSLTPDGRYLIYQQNHPETRNDLWLLPLQEDRKATPLAISKFDELDGAVSPDGRWLAYQTDESGRPQIYVQSFPDPTDRWQVSSDGGAHPRWSADGRELFYVSGQRLLAAPVRADAEFSSGKPAVVFEGAFRSYDLARDGRILLLRPDPQTPPADVQIVLHWFDELRRRVPGTR